MKSFEKDGAVYRQFKPKGLLSTFVKSFWFYENKKTESQSYSLFPDGCFALIIFYSKDEEKEIFFLGLWDKSLEVSISGKTKILAIKFKPIAAEYIVGRKIGEFKNSLVPISNTEWELLSQLNTSFQEFESFIENNSVKLESIIGIGKGVDQRKTKLFELLYQNQGLISVTEIAAQVHWSNRQMSRYFKEYFGLSMKQYANILRVNSTFDDFSKGENYSNTEYFDQSHFIKEVKKHTGESPKSLSKNQNGRFLQLSTRKGK